MLFRIFLVVLVSFIIKTIIRFIRYFK